MKILSRFLPKWTDDQNVRLTAFQFPNSSIPKTTINLTPEKPVLPLETMSQFAEPVIPDERRFAGRDPESSVGSYNQIFSGSRLASVAAGLGRDDKLPHSLLMGEGTCSYGAKLNK